MYTEYEAKFPNIDKDKIRKTLKKAGAKLIKPEFLQRRVVFNLPKGPDGKSWLRIRDEVDKITMSLKEAKGNKIEDQKEIMLIIDSFDKGVEFLKKIGCREKAYQENKREIWQLDGVEICIDEWPFLEPFVEIEGNSEEKVKSVAEKLGFDYSKARFGSTDILVMEKYGLSSETINNKIPKLTFDMENPYLRKERDRK